MKRLVMLIAIGLSLLSGCESSKRLLYENPSINDAKQGQECLLPDPVGLGRSLDVYGGEAMRRSGITKLRSLEYQVVKFHSVGRECVIAHGE